jgi:zinc transport system permease protein
MLDDFFARAVLGGIGIAAVAGPLGCFVVWRRMAYFGDSLAHSALLGVALGALIGMHFNLAILAICCGFALLLVVLQQQRMLATDTILGLLSHTSLSIGIVALSFVETVRIDLMGYLFGDVLAMTRTDLLWIYGGGALVLAAVGLIWSKLLAITLNEELAQAEGVAVLPVRLGFMLLIAVMVAIAMKLIGILLITSLLIIPPAAARQFARTPEQMAVLAAVAGALAVLLGLYGSLTWDTPSGPSIVVAAAALFVLSLAGGPALRHLPRAHRGP